MDKKTIIDCVVEKLVDYKNLINDIYKALLLRDADPEGLKSCSVILEKEGLKALPVIIGGIINSEEFFLKYTEFIRNDFSKYYTLYEKTSAFYDLCNTSAYVIIHIPKTAGISLRKYIYEHFKDEIFPSPTGISSASMFKYPLSFFLKYRFIMGHIDYDFVKLIPKKEKFLITFLREPVSRIWSLYNYWKFNVPHSLHPDYEVPLDANELPKLEFFEKYQTMLWNEISRYVLGNSNFLEIKNEYFNLSAETRKYFLENKIRPMIQRRMKEFFFIGIYEDYERGLRNLVKKLGKEPLQYVPRENVNMQKTQLTEEDRNIIEPLVDIDKIIYEEGKKLYEENFQKEI